MKKQYNLDNLSTLVKGNLVIIIISKRISKDMMKKYPDLYSLAYLHLMFIKNVEGISQVELADLTNTNTSTMHRNIKSLTDNNYIVKKISTRANENEIYLTQKGEQVVKDIIEWVNEYEKEMGFNEENTRELTMMFKKIINKYSDF
ncbi:MarR family winged helix-turn-helix transcriptional regulator [Spiroplasma endosymbiont of Dioctria linearis]|uniref:MarR family winged helix-turn-helix transcriptional regulator n=1 Tax=Spiroplasma endosymbiont of Dioctria linearis TaxID=3066290 RepID=UPI00313D8C2D